MIPITPDLNNDDRMTDKEKATVRLALALSIISGFSTWMIATMFGASSKTAQTIGYSTAGGILGVALIVGFICAVYDDCYKDNNSVRNGVTHETTEPTESAALLSRETFEAQESASEVPNPAPSKKSSIASMLTAGYGATPQQVESPYEADAPTLDVANTAFQC